MQTTWKGARLSFSEHKMRYNAFIICIRIIANNRTEKRSKIFGGKVTTLGQLQYWSIVCQYSARCCSNLLSGSNSMSYSFMILFLVDRIFLGQLGEEKISASKIHRTGSIDVTRYRLVDNLIGEEFLRGWGRRRQR